MLKINYTQRSYRQYLPCQTTLQVLEAEPHESAMIATLFI